MFELVVIQRAKLATFVREVLINASVGERRWGQWVFFKPTG